MSPIYAFPLELLDLRVQGPRVKKRAATECRKAPRSEMRSRKPGPLEKTLRAILPVWQAGYSFTLGVCC